MRDSRIVRKGYIQRARISSAKIQKGLKPFRTIALSNILERPAGLLSPVVCTDKPFSINDLPSVAGKEVAEAPAIDDVVMASGIRQGLM